MHKHYFNELLVTRQSAVSYTSLRTVLYVISNIIMMMMMTEVVTISLCVAGAEAGSAERSIYLASCYAGTPHDFSALSHINTDQRRHTYKLLSVQTPDSSPSQSCSTSHQNASALSALLSAQ